MTQAHSLPLAAALLLALGAGAPAAAQTPDFPAVSYPAVPERSADIDGFVPAGWLVDASAEGDLDRDGRSDLALVIRMNDASNMIPADMCGETLDTNPRMLIVALAAPGGGYRRVADDHALIPRRDNACAVDPFAPDNIEIGRGSLHLSLEHFMSAGGWDAGTTTFALRWQEGAMRLIGWDYSNVHRNTGCIQTLSVNFLTGAVRTTEGNIGTDVDQVSRSRLTHRALPTLAGIGDGFMYDPQRLIERLPTCDAGGDE
jgi:hypothetical protein